MSKDIETKVTDIVNGNNLSHSQIDRLIDPRTLLMNYLSSHIDKISSTNSLKVKIEEQLLGELEEGNMSTGAMLKVYEILAKQETDNSTGIINLLTKALEIKKEDPKPNEGGKGSSTEGSFSQDDISKAKKFLSAIDKIERGESSPKDFLKRKESE